jgi:hypothetical protein
MQFLRNAHRISAFVLVWFALYIGVAIASPMVNPKGLQLVCSGSGGSKIASTGDDDSAPSGHHTLDCPLCAGVGAPPPVEIASFKSVQPVAFALQRIASAHIASASAAPMPARGPPVSP